jgi:hypothetical protein
LFSGSHGKKVLARYVSESPKTLTGCAVMLVLWAAQNPDPHKPHARDVKAVCGFMRQV